MTLLWKHQKIENEGAMDIKGVNVEQGRDNSELT
jgi:hypothetical protein